jgi:hypothetical protein
MVDISGLPSNLCDESFMALKKKIVVNKYTTMTRGMRLSREAEEASRRKDLGRVMMRSLLAEEKEDACDRALEAIRNAVVDCNSTPSSSLRCLFWRAPRSERERSKYTDAALKR